MNKFILELAIEEDGLLKLHRTTDLIEHGHVMEAVTTTFRLNKNVKSIAVLELKPTFTAQFDRPQSKKEN